MIGDKGTPDPQDPRNPLHEGARGCGDQTWDMTYTVDNTP